MKKILFVCKHNMFRSKIAEIYFNKINRNKSIKTESAGLIKGNLPLDKQEVNVAKEFGIKLKGNPKGLSIDLIKQQNLIIIVANDVPKETFNKKEYINFKTTTIIKWKIVDKVDGDSDFKIRKIIKLIIGKVEQLNKELEKIK